MYSTTFSAEWRVTQAGLHRTRETTPKSLNTSTMVDWVRSPRNRFSTALSPYLPRCGINEALWRCPEEKALDQAASRKQFRRKQSLHLHKSSEPLSTIIHLLRGKCALFLSKIKCAIVDYRNSNYLGSLKSRKLSTQTKSQQHTPILRASRNGTRKGEGEFARQRA